ncbi:GIY-YIG nuclease family protein [Desulfospira joergensenii]|uniref:GIY-YIG nuclease family protein n=1 Tax=Desulfospira joergensenii TaxID=53329 RepID=UPI0003B6740E|nr:GIY-YIG nuclease family protein [Desulfospira joergensenii]
MKNKTEAKDWQVYLLTCSDGSLYCGVTKNLENRLALHNLGKASKYTRSRRPVTLAGATKGMTKAMAFRLEYRIKQLKPGEKLAALDREASLG